VGQHGVGVMNAYQRSVGSCRYIRKRTKVKIPEQWGDEGGGAVPEDSRRNGRPIRVFPRPSRFSSPQARKIGGRRAVETRY